MTHASTPTSRQDRRRRRKALLAGGLVLGVGSAATLAAFTDDVFSGGSFNSAKFSIQGSPATAYPAAKDPSFRDFPGPNGGGDASGVAVLTFAAQMTPGDTVYAPFTIQTAAASGAGTVTLAGANISAPGSLDLHLTYAVRTGGTTCSLAGATTSNGTPWATGTPGGTSTAPAAAAITGTNPLPLSAAAAGVQKFCIAVTLANTQAAKDAINGASTVTPTSITWDFRGIAS